jgi:hypothetical protein
MRGTNGPMDVITRAEFDDYMKDIPTKEDLLSALAGTSAEIVSVKDRIDDIKVDLLDAIETRTSEAKLSIAMRSATTRELEDAKVEILATTRRNLVDAIAPLATKAELRGVKSEMEQGFLKMEARLDTMEHKINTVVMDGFTSLKEMMESFTAEMRGIVKHHEQRLDRHDADLYKLRQSGVLQ